MTLKARHKAYDYEIPVWELPTSKIKATIVYGQSRADNRSEGTAWCVYPRPDENSRLLMMNNPRAPGRTFEGPFDPDDAGAFVPLEDCRYGSHDDPGGHVNVSGDPLGQSLASSLFALDDADVAAGRDLRRRVLLVAGEGGTTIAELSKNAAPYVGSGGTFVIYDRMIAMVERCIELASLLYGQEVEIETIYWLQGEADANTATQASYYAALETLIEDITTDVVALTGQSFTPVFLMDQVASKSSDGAGNEASLAQLQSAVENNNGYTYMIGPANCMAVNARDPGATYHMNSMSVLAWGEKFAYQRNKILNGLPPELCYVTSSRVDGATLTLTVNTPQAPLVVDDDIPIAPHYGFVLDDPGGGLINSVSLNNNKIIIDLTKVPSTGATIEYAFNSSLGIGGPAGLPWPSKLDLEGNECSTAGAWGNIRDSRAINCTYADDYVLKNFLCTFRMEIA